MLPTYSHQEYRLWLSGKAPDAPMGDNHDGEKNPMTVFLRDHTGRSDLWFAQAIVIYIDGVTWCEEPTPDWAVAYSFLASHDSVRFPTATDCLRVLANATRGMP